MARRKFYMSRDGENGITLWYGKPKWDDGFFYHDDWRADLISFSPHACLAKTAWPSIKPCDLKLGECVEIKIPKFELAK